MMILTYLVLVNGFVGLITFKPKYMEQIYGQSASTAIFYIGTEQMQTFTPRVCVCVCSLHFGADGN